MAQTERFDLLALTCAVPNNGVTMVTRRTSFAIKASGIRQTLPTFSRHVITVAFGKRIDVVVTEARLAAPPWNKGVTIVTIGTLFALLPCVAFLLTEITNEIVS